MPAQPTKSETDVKDVERCRRQPVVPDGGWGWVVCFAAACTCFTVNGLTSSTGIFLIGLRRIFDDPISKLSLIGALISGLSMLAAPVASVLLYFFSHRTVMILSGFIGCTGAILGAFSASSDMMIITYGLISGLSTGIAFFACHIITGLYFDKKRALAIGIINCGGGVGLMLMSLFLEHFIELYGLRGTLLLISGLLLNFIVYGSLCRPLPSTYTDAKKTAYIDATNPSSAMELRSALPEPEYGENAKRKVKLNQVSDISNENQNTGSLPVAAADNFINDVSIVKTQKVDRNSILKLCSTIIGVEHFRNINFVLLTMSYTFWVFTMTTYTYIPPLCVWTFGMSEKQAAILMSLLGLLTTLGNVILGVLVDIFHISSNKMYIFSMLVLTICVIMVPHCDKFEYITPVICLFGLANGFSVSLRLILTTEISGLEHATKAYSILSFINGISYFAAPPLFGLIFDTTNSFLAVYYGGGACALTGLLLFLIIVCRNTFYKKRLRK
ncbi:monocarboxylate transporter 9-like [Octopus sinensis]|uniref:Monocarboxylate transporter 9-like n=1 Tax=Octopus sinensis TaxID=2607531 RepID=A0A6P7TY57_9MOLL|nr:monocarboxylate transporter 9-like [Octopus sinensis]